ncbi:RodZ domain-containing protein [Acidihalobacter ferrooxydans]|uniref:HTH cro/C1-type domain-containing protein n=1 Tax=Acidihalobacter ferrooxydans TaxID=1765967 RepID=A0A1P8UGU5_9GAMM|nr:RodZ domain-containing protein [Acidihalobacter ferrooxydans]APZ43067.1 hypothetical protein BW247_08160 [Acidihalobacter ferrooxydans]
MTHQADSSPPIDAPDSTVGARLRRAREALGMSLEHAAQTLNLDKKTIAALESDAKESLPESAYVKGYLRAYARLLNLDADALLALYAEDEEPTRVVTPPPIRRSQRDQPRMSVSVVGGVVVLLLIVLSVWWFSRPKHTSIPVQGVVPATQPSLASSGSAVPANPVRLANAATATATPAASTTLGVTATATAAPVVEPTITAPASPPPVAAAPVSAPAVQTAAPTQPANTASGTQLLLRTTAKSWVKIDDATGKQLLIGLLPGDARKTLTGKPPFSVFLGYAPGVTLIINGNQVAFSSYTQSNNTARFKVLADGQTRR